MAALLKILIVDDEPEARELLAHMLHEEKDLEITGMAADVDEAVRKTLMDRPDLVILDIQMPVQDGFDYIEQIHTAGYDPGIIFVTAYENYAIRAIRNAVFDYLLKPIRQKELQMSIQRFRNRRREGEKGQLNSLLQLLKGEGPRKIKLNTRSGYVLINPGDILFCKADGNYTHMHMVNGGTELTTHNLGVLERFLDGDRFFRASRSFLINLSYLSRVDRKGSSCTLEYRGVSCSIKLPVKRIKALELHYP